MRIIPFIAIALLEFSAHAKSVEAPCVQACPQTCITREMAMISAQVQCMPNLDKRIDRCAQQFGQCVRVSKERCEWRATKKYKRCLSKKS